MNERRRPACCALFVLMVILLASGPAQAARLQILTPDGAETECDEENGDDCAETGGPLGDPVVCLIATATGSQLLQCLGGEFEGGGYGVDYIMEDGGPAMDVYLNQGPGGGPPADPGPEDEIASFCFREADDFIQFARIEVDQPNLAAKIHTFVETPAPSGEIRVDVNGHEVVVDVAPASKSVKRLNLRVCAALQLNFDADCLENFFVIYADHNGDTPRSLGLATDVVGIKTMEIALEPTGEPADATACSPPPVPAFGDLSAAR